jgi:hypothetical protein
LIYFASAQIALLRQTYFVRWVGGFVGLSVSIDNGKERNAEMGENFYLTLKKRS